MKYFKENRSEREFEIESPDSEYEKEANAKADEITQGSKSGISSGKGSPMNIRQTGNFVKPMKSAKTSTLRMSTGKTVNPMSRRSSLSALESNSSGNSLSPELKTEMGQKMGADLNDVKIHTDQQAIQMSEEMGANAFAYGNDIYFNAGQYNPSSDKGKHLLAHELVHTQQQKGGKMIQRDIKQSGFSVGGGDFKIAMTKVEEKGTKKWYEKEYTGVEVDIEFLAGLNSADSQEINLIQIVRSTAGSGSSEVDYTWGWPEQDRNEMRTDTNNNPSNEYVTVDKDTLKTISDSETSGAIIPFEIHKINSGVLGEFNENKEIPKGTVLKIPTTEASSGYFVDHKAGKARPRRNEGSKEVPLHYSHYWPSKGRSHSGFNNRMSAGQATLVDFPHTTNTEATGGYYFETVARAKEGIDYGTLYWGFDVDKGKVTNEYSYEKEGTSQTFKSAVSEFNSFYKNHHQVVKGDTLKSLAKLYFNDETKAEEIRKANGLDGVDSPLTPGKEIIIPGITK